MSAGPATGDAAGPGTLLAPPSFRAESTPLLRSRMRAGLLLVALSIACYGALELWLERDVLPALLAVKAIQIATVAGVYAALGFVRGWRATVALGLFTMLEVCATLAVSGVLTNEVASTPTLFVVVTMAAGALLPWGLWPQVASVAIAAAATAYNVAAVAAVPPQFVYSAIAAGLAAVSSVYVAYAFDRHRFRQWCDERDLQVTVRELRAEVRLASTLARASRQLATAADPAVLLDGVARLAVEALGGDCACAFRRRPADGAFVPAGAHGLPAADVAALRGRALPAFALEGPLRELARTPVLEIAEGASADVFPLGARRSLCLALTSHDEVAALVVVARRTSAARFADDEHRVAEGLARTASLALRNIRLTRRVQRVNRMKSRLFAVLSHELRTPVGILLGLAEMARDEALPPADRDEALRRIGRTASELRELVDSTLELGRIEAGRDPVQRETVDLGALWEALGQRCALLPRRPGVLLDWRAVEAGVTAHSDPRKLAVVVRNLVGNAVKFTHEGWVRASLAVERDAFVVHVLDTGVGITPEAQTRIFAPFDRGDASVAARSDGTGLGLYIVRRFVRQLGGTVLLESTPGRGTTVSVRLPLHAARSMAA